MDDINKNAFYNANINKILNTKMNCVVKQYYINILYKKYHNVDVEHYI